MTVPSPSSVLQAIALSALLAHATAALAQQGTLASELDRVRATRQHSALGASDKVAQIGFRQLLDAEQQPGLKDSALWEVADIHLAAANKWSPGADNAYARRAIDAWAEYIQFAMDSGNTARIHRAVEFIQRSYIHAGEFQGMFDYFQRISPKYVNDNTLTRWEDRLRTCADFGPPPKPWTEQACRQDSCRAPVADFYDYAQRWLIEFPLKEEAKRVYVSRIGKIPKTCRTW